VFKDTLTECIKTAAKTSYEKIRANTLQSGGADELDDKLLVSLVDKLMADIAEEAIYQDTFEKRTE
jgi:hypothetical protein